MRDRDQFSHVARKVQPLDSKGLLQANLHAAEAPQCYLLLDLSQDTDARIRFQSCIFPNEETPLFYVDICNDTHKANYHTLHVPKHARPKLCKQSFRNVTGSS